MSNGENWLKCSNIYYDRRQDYGLLLTYRMDCGQVLTISPCVITTRYSGSLISHLNIDTV